MAAERVITVMGATGYTGRLIAAELRCRGLRFAIAGRRAAKLEQLSEALGGVELHVADVRERSSLNALAARSRVIINCAGPFVDLGEPVVLAAIEHGAHYLDTAGEQPFVKSVRARDAEAKAQRVAVVPAMAAEVAPGDCAAALAAEGFSDLQAIQVTYIVRMHASQGTMRTVARMAGGSAYAYVGGDWVEEPPARRRTVVDFPPPIGTVSAVSFPSAEVITVPMHERVREVRTFMRVPAVAARLLSAVSPLLPVLGGVTSPLASRWIGEGTGGPDDSARAASHFHLAVDARGIRNGRAARRRVLVSGHDPYGLTAVIAATGAERMCEAAFDKAGVLPPARLVDPRGFLDSLAPAGVTYRVSDE